MIWINKSKNSFENKVALLDVYKKLSKAELQVARGVPLIDGEEVFSKLRGKYARRQYK